MELNVIDEMEHSQCMHAGKCDFADLANRVSKLEARIVMMADNLSGFAMQHQRLHGQLASTLQQQGKLVEQLVNAARGVAGTDWASLFGEEIPGAKRLTRRAWKFIAGGIAVLVTLGSLVQYVRGETPESAPTHAESK